MISNVSKPIIPLVKLAHQLIAEVAKTGDIVVDATVGNGHDTIFLLNLVGATGKVYGFDIQSSAIAATKTTLQPNPHHENVILINECHTKMRTTIPTHFHGNIKAIMFNLGYLPGSDKQIITQTDSTLSALNEACDLLTINGIITILAYPGHVGGDTETQHIKAWCLGLNTKQYQVHLYESASDKPAAPVLFTLIKLS